MSGRSPAVEARKPGSRWATVPVLRTVLVVVRSPAALNRLLDVLPVFEGDTRVELVFTVDRGSSFSAGLEARLTAAGARVVPWERAMSGSFDLALAASDNGDLHRVPAPLVLFPHGVGYQRFAAHEPGAVSGLRRSTLVRDGTVVPDRIVVSHGGQLDVVHGVDPRLAAHVVVAGDLCHDRIRNSVPDRDRYRAAFGATGRRLVVLCSTWGSYSLFGRQPGLPARVVAELAADSYRAALVLHPNVWARHGALQIRTWLRPALDAGLVLVPPEEGWRAALVAADLVVSDHGSLTCYAAGAGAAVLLAEDGGPEVVPGSPIDLLRRRLPRLRRDVPLGDQLGQDPTRAAVPEVALFAHPGRSADLVRAVVYEVLGLAVPRLPVRVRPVPVPDLVAITPTVYAVRSTVEVWEGGREDVAAVTLHRYPAVTYDEEQPRPRHLAASDSEPDPGWAERAAVVWRPGPAVSAPAADTWANRTLERLPAVRVVVAPVLDGGHVVALRDGRRLRVVEETDGSSLGSAVHTLVVRGAPLDEVRRLLITTGTTTTSVRLRWGDRGADHQQA